MSSLPDLQDAVRRISGVAAAMIRWPDPAGPASLRVEFADGADPHAVGEEVIRAMVEVGDVDLATLQLERGSTEREPPRAIFTRLVLDRLDDELEVTVELDFLGTKFSGTQRGVVGEREELGLVARAAMAALEDIRSDGYTVRGVDRIVVAGGTDVVTVVVDSALEHQHTLVGSAMVVRDAREATVRATLDAMNRVLAWGTASPA